MVGCHLSVLLPSRISPNQILVSALEESSDCILSELDVLGMLSATAEEWYIVIASSAKCHIFASSSEDHWTLQLRFNGPHFLGSASPIKWTISTANPRMSTRGSV